VVDLAVLVVDVVELHQVHLLVVGLELHLRNNKNSGINYFVQNKCLVFGFLFCVIS